MSNHSITAATISRIHRFYGQSSRRSGKIIMFTMCLCEVAFQSIDCELSVHDCCVRGNIVVHENFIVTFQAPNKYLFVAKKGRVYCMKMEARPMNRM